MRYQVILADEAKADANRIYDWVVGQAPVRGPEWFETHFYRCPLAREAKEARREIRCLLFGKRRHAYRILYEVDELRESVWILHIRPGALRDLGPEELSQPSRDRPRNKLIKIRSGAVTPASRRFRTAPSSCPPFD